MEISVRKVLVIAVSICVMGTAITMGLVQDSRDGSEGAEAAEVGDPISTSEKREEPHSERSDDAGAPEEPPDGGDTQADVPERLSREMVKSTLATYTTWISECARNQNQNDLQGAVKIKFVIQPSGETARVKIGSERFEGTDVGECIRELVAEMKFPASQSDQPVEFPFPVEPNEAF